MRETLPGILTQPLLDPQVEQAIVPSEECEPFPYLKIYSGFRCTHCRLVSQCTVRLQHHYNTEHAAIRRRRGGIKGSGSRTIRKRLEQEHFGNQAPWRAVKFQRIFSRGRGSTGFRVRDSTNKRSEVDARQKANERLCVSEQSHKNVTEEVLQSLARIEGRKVPPWCQPSGCYATYSDAGARRSCSLQGSNILQR